jgi:hypothetical protein
MGYNDEYAFPRHSVFDIETVPLDNAGDYIGAVVLPMPPNLEAITAAKNLTDPVKIAADVAKKREAALADYAESTEKAHREHAAKLSRCSLDWNLNRIVAIGLQNIGDGGPQVVVCKNEDEERAALAAFWLQTKGRRLVGFHARAFDAPTLIQRSRYLGVTPRMLSLARWGKGDVVDLRDLLTFDDIRYEAIMPRSLDMFCRRAGIDVPDAYSGADIGRLVSEGQWEAVMSHCRADIEKTRRLAQWAGVFSESEVAA